MPNWSVIIAARCGMKQGELILEREFSVACTKLQENTPGDKHKELILEKVSSLVRGNYRHTRQMSLGKVPP